MLNVTSSLVKGTLSLRPLCKETDRTIVRELFRREFYGALPLHYSDEGLWEIYDRMETEDPFGAYLVFCNDRLRFLLEIHLAVQMDLAADWLLEPGTIGIYCFFASPNEQLDLLAFRACIEALLNYPSVGRIVTRVNFTAPNDVRVALLEKAGFRRLTLSSDRSAIYFCVQDTFPILGGNSRNSRLHSFVE